MRFVDTSFWIALNRHRERHYDVARQVWDRYREDSLVSSNLVLGETWTFLRRREGHQRAVAFLDALERSKLLDIVRVDDDDEIEAWRWLRRHDERAYSFVDATSFALMRRIRIREALAFDGDFSAAGFVEVRPA
jgi:predicted nucleic acid-binding protein